MPESERRYFPRVNYRAYATLTTAKRRWPVHILDLSFNGALAVIIHPHELFDGESVVLNLEIESGGVIKMQGRISHQKEHFVGIECRALGIDNQTRLRELLEKHKSPAEENLTQRSYATLLKTHESSLASR